MKEKNIQELAIRMGLITVEDMCQYTIAQLVVKIANKVNELVNEVWRFETDVQETLKTQNENIQYLLGEGLHLEVENIFEDWVNDGTFDTLINQTALKSINDRVDETITHLTHFENKTNDDLKNVMTQNYKDIFPKIKSTNFYVPYNTDEFGDYRTIINKIKDCGNNTISFCLRLNMEEKTSNTLERVASDSLVVEYVDYAISKGLKIMLKFHISGKGGGGSANIQPTDTRTWIKSLRDNVLYYCDLLGDKVSIICLSNECTHQTNDNEDLWMQFNNMVKAKNPNYITTTATTMVEVDTTVLYKYVDVMGINLYIGIGGDLNTEQADRDKAFFNDYSNHVDYITKINKLSNKYNKKFMITECGCLPTVEALKYPAKWNYPNGFVENQTAQKVYYETALKCFMNMSNIYGVSLWCATDGFTYLDREAEQVVRQYFKGVL